MSAQVNGGRGLKERNLNTALKVAFPTLLACVKILALGVSAVVFAAMAHLIRVILGTPAELSRSISLVSCRKGHTTMSRKPARPKRTARTSSALRTSAARRCQRQACRRSYSFTR